MGETQNRWLTNLSLEGFKSIRELKDFEMRNLNILIGANGSGKSNFLEVFRFLREMLQQNLQRYVLTNGGTDSFLHNGPKYAMAIKGHFSFGLNEYRFDIWRTVEQTFQILAEEQKFLNFDWKIVSSNCLESKLKDINNQFGDSDSYSIDHYMYETISSWTYYHFHDTSNQAGMKGFSKVVDKWRLKSDASNIAPVLLNMKEEYYDEYRYLIRIIRLVAPYFDELILKPEKNGAHNLVKLLWKQRGTDNVMEPFQLSDGTLRFICLLASLMQPNPPPTIIIDEPELGLHPEAIYVLSDIMKSASEKTQIITATQSPTFIDYFEPEDIITVNREEGASIFKRLKTEELNVWLEDYSLGQLWRKNVVEGGTSYEEG